MSPLSGLIKILPEYFLPSTVIFIRLCVSDNAPFIPAFAAALCTVTPPAAAFTAACLTPPAAFTAAAPIAPVTFFTAAAPIAPVTFFTAAVTGASFTPPADAVMSTNAISGSSSRIVDPIGSNVVSSSLR